MLIWGIPPAMWEQDGGITRVLMHFDVTWAELQTVE